MWKTGKPAEQEFSFLLKQFGRRARWN